MNSTLEPAVHSAPKLDALRRQIRPNCFVHFRAVQRVNVLVQVVRHEAPQRKRLLRQPQIQPVLLAVSNERTKLARHHVIMQDQQEALVKLERIVPLLHQLPGAVQQLGKHRRDLLRVVLDVTAAVAKLVPKGEPVLFDESLETHEKP